VEALVTTIDRRVEAAAVGVDRPIPGVRPASVVENALTVLFGVWMLGGSLTDAWAHVNRLRTLDSFFTPWHTLLYTGVAALCGWTYRLAYRRRDVAPRWWYDGWPAGYRLGAVGALVVVAGGGGDGVWHQVFGIEVSIEALLSPTHLMLAVGAVLLLSSPLRSWRAAGTPGGWHAVTGVASLALTTVPVSSFLLYASAFRYAPPTIPYDRVTGSPSEIVASLGFASYVITTMLFVVPLLMVYRRRATPGTATAMVGAVSLYAMVIYEFPAAQTAGAIGATAAAALVDVLLVRLEGSELARSRLRLPVAGALFATLVWSGHVLGLYLGAGIAWSVQLWAGTVVLTALVAALLGMHVATGSPAPRPGAA
jgi:hypothetical protein